MKENAKNTLVNKINNLITANINNANNYIERLVAYDVITSKKVLYEVCHDWDPPWDCSGVLEETGTYNIDDNFSFTDYLEFYTGNSIPSFCSGCGTWP